MLKIINKVFSGKEELVKEDIELVEEISKEFMREGFGCPMRRN